MKYRNARFKHEQKDKVGVLITNLGTPDAPTAKALRPYLKQFLSDPRVIEIPRLLWWCILNLVILVIRPPRSAHAYKSVWTEQGSPLALYTQKQAEKLKEKLQRSLPPQHSEKVELQWAMRYGNPSIGAAIQSMMDKGVRKLIVLPLYPQYSATTTASTFDAIAEDFTQRRWMPELRFLTSYHDRPEYITALADSIKQYRDAHGKADKLLFSFHGIPQRYLHNGDPYHCQCHKTARLVAEHLQLTQEDYLVSFQSRVGREEWLKPYTDETIKSLPSEGIKSLQVICPGFSADCLETLEEIEVENREYFMTSGGEKFEYIPALNDSNAHIDCLANIITENLDGWMKNERDASHTEALAKAHPFNHPPKN